MDHPAMVIVLLGIFLVSVAASNLRDDSHPSFYTDFNYDAPLQYEDQEPEPEPYNQSECYSCAYHTRRGRSAGKVDCNDLFFKSGIYLGPCPGLCAKMYYRPKSKDAQYTITRSCLPRCADMKDPDEKGDIQCCTGSSCNGVHPATAIP